MPDSQASSNEFKIGFAGYDIFAASTKYPLTFSDSEIIFYSPNKDHQFGVLYADIDYVWDVAWRVWLYFSGKIYERYSKEELKRVTRWFYPAPLMTPHVDQNPYYINIYCRQRTHLLQAFKEHGIPAYQGFLKRPV